MMTASMWIAVQFVVLAIALGFGAAAPESLSQTVLVVLLSALVIASISRKVSRASLRVLGWLRHDPPARPQALEAVSCLFSGAPGAAGTVAVRAPALATHAIA
ncbi:hypothetical protein [Leucobacter sp. 1207-22]|uniref:hypothetical protein n=1 Tax=Leucobacter sp. 1207-22 TaxID=2604456 RepID=UPI004063CD14